MYHNSVLRTNSGTFPVSNFILDCCNSKPDSGTPNSGISIYGPRLRTQLFFFSLDTDVHPLAWAEGCLELSVEVAAQQ